MIASSFSAGAGESLGEEVAVRVARGESGPVQEVRARGSGEDVRWAALFRTRMRSGEARFGLGMPALGGRLLVGNQRRLVSSERRDPLEVREDSRLPALSVARSAVGASWARPEGTLLSLGRTAGGHAVAAVRTGRRGAVVGASFSEGVWRGELDWGARGAGVPVRVSCSGSAREGDGLLRLGGEDARVVVRLSRSAGVVRHTVSARVGADSGGGVRLSAVAHGGPDAAPGAWRVEWSRAVGGWRLRSRSWSRGRGILWRAGWERSLAPGLRTELIAARAPSRELRAGVVLSGRGVRGGGRLVLRGAGPRSGSAWILTPLPGRSHLALRFAWRARRRPSVEAEWKAAFAPRLGN